MFKNKISKVFIIFLTFILLTPLIFNSSNIYAKNVNSKQNTNLKVSPENISIKQGEKFDIDISLNCNFTGSILAFTLDIQLQDEYIYYNKIKQLYNNIETKDINTNKTENKLRILYLANGDGLNVTKGVNSNILKFEFVALDNIDTTTNITFKINDVVSNTLESTTTNDACNVQVTIFDHIPEDLRLESLFCNEGDLVPEFKSDITQYEMDVASDINQVIFYAKPINEESSVKINRKTLYKAGTSTLITATVKSSYDNNVLVYNINVNRLLPDDTNNESNSSKNSKNGSSSNPKSTGTTSSNPKNKSNPNSTYDNDKINLPIGNKEISVKKSSFIIFMSILALAVAGSVTFILLKNKKDAKNKEEQIEEEIKDEN